jgi:hypothetical protein
MSSPRTRLASRGPLGLCIEERPSMTITFDNLSRAHVRIAASISPDTKSFRGRELRASQLANAKGGLRNAAA